MKLVFIYVLIDPRDGKTRYLGKTNDPFSRFKAHLGSKKKSTRSPKLFSWIEELKAENLIPELKIVEIVRLEDSRFTEFNWWKKLRGSGEALLNETSPSTLIDKYAKSWTTEDLVELINSIKMYSPRTNSNV